MLRSVTAWLITRIYIYSYLKLSIACSLIYCIFLLSYDPRVLKIMRVLRLKFRGEEISSVAKQTIAFNYLLEGLKMEVDQVESIKKIELLKLRSLRKLCLVLDLDHTLLHTKKLATLSPEQKSEISLYRGDDMFTWKLPGEPMVTKLRPFVRRFLQEASEMFQLYVYTMGSRDYALHIVEEFLDPQGIYFGKRVITREDCTVKGEKGLDVVPIDPSIVLVLDDTERVWKRNSKNLILIDRYKYFVKGGRDESEEAGGLRFALKVLKKLHYVYFEWYDRCKEGDVRELVQNHWEDFISDEGQQEVGTETCSSAMGFWKLSRVEEECSRVTKRQRIC